MAHSLCRLCGFELCKPLFVVEGYPIERCSNCEFVQVRDEPDPALLVKIYDQLHIKHLTYRNEAAAIQENLRRVELLRRHIAEGAEVLDAGCATGDFLAQARGSFRMFGLDISPGAIQIARERLPDIADRLWAGCIEDMAEKGDTYDAICLWDVIEHLWDPAETCRQLFARLRPGGILFVSTPDSGALIAKVMGRSWAFMIPPEHLSLFSAKSFQYLFGRIVKGEIIYHVSQGKWTNLAFILYKLERMVGTRFPPRFMAWAARASWGCRLIYVPTKDIQYLAVRKPG
jgi:2-polyprenyl-3-methyl-5-hydroxy-6-metoxy-1,4-benzoquinol methylase